MTAVLRTMAGMALVAAVLLFLMVRGHLMSNAATYRFRMTIEVRTPRGVVSASSVY